MARGDDIEEKLIDFAVRVLRVCQALPSSPTGRHIHGQLVRSGTSPAPNYAEARGAESGRDFIHKLKIVLKELNETRVWLKIIIRADLLPEQRLHDVLSECDQLCRIISSSIHTARQNSPRTSDH
ncbi:MAG: four helix bundle protein [Ardenticatenaceae bacterium]|nr:four helix bundle protein [Ardenticatenaceae bacterium]